MLTHLIEVDVASGTIVGEWKNDTSRISPPVAPEGRTFIDVTDRGVDLGTLSLTHHIVDGQLVERPPRAPMVSKVQFILLFTPQQRAAIRAYRKANDDDEIEDFYEFLQMATGDLDTSLPEVQALISQGLGLLVARELLTQQEAARIGAGTPPA